MNLRAYPVFQKDLRILLRQLAGAIVAQVAFMILVPLCQLLFAVWSGPGPYNRHNSILSDEGLWHPAQSPLLGSWFPILQITICIILALFVAMQWSAVKRGKESLFFMRWLTASKSRNGSEKTASGLNLLIVLLAVQITLIVLQCLYALWIDAGGLYRRSVSPRALFGEWFPSLQITVCAILPLCAAAQWSAEERNGGNLIFLRRLAASKTRIWGEKTAAGVTALILLLIVQSVWFFTLLKSNLIVVDPEENFIRFYVLIALASYIVGLPYSLVMTQTIGVILLGIFTEFVVLCLYAVGSDELRMPTWQTWSILAIFVVPCAAAVASELSGFRIGIFAPAQRNSKIIPLVFKEIRDNAVLYMFAFALGLFAFFDLPIPALCVLIASILILSATIGASIYSQQDKDPRRCILYFHPIPRSLIYCVKFVVGFLMASFLSVMMLIVIVKYSSAAGHKSLIEVLEPSGHDGFVSSCFFFFAIGLIPYFCGVLLSQAFQRSLYAALAALPVALFTYLIILYLGAMGLITLGAARMFQMRDWEPITIVSLFPWPLILILVGYGLSALRASTDTSVLTGTTWERQRYILRLGLFVVAAVFFICTTGWGDLLYLITGIDLGIG